MPGRGPRSGVDARRAAAVLLLVAVAAVGLRAGGAFSAAGAGLLGMSGHALYGVLGVTEAILAVAGLILLVAGYVLSRRDGPSQRKRRSIWWVLLLPIVMFGLARILAKFRGHGAGRHAGAPAAPGVARIAHAHPLPPGNAWPLLGLFAAVALAAGLLTAYRRRRDAALASGKGA